MFQIGESATSGPSLPVGVAASADGPRVRAMDLEDLSQLRASVVVVPEFRYLGHTLLHQRRIRICGDVPGGGLVAAINVVVDKADKESGAVAVLKPDEKSVLVPLQAKTEVDLAKAVELCAGCGAMGQGLAFAGIRSVLQVEWMTRICDVMRMQAHANVIQGDITDPETHGSILRAQTNASVVIAGVSCQPYSQLGDQAGGADLRAMTLPSTLKIAYLLQAQVIILECVPQAGADAWVKKVIQSFARQVGFKVVEQVQQLSNAWCSNRLRWWCIIAHPTVAPMQLPQLPSCPEYQKVMQILPSLRKWPKSETRQIELTAYELRRFADFKPLQAYVIRADAAAPTALHSWGSQVYGCACGCRMYPFSESRLEAKGLHGALVVDRCERHADGSLHQVFRHLHPREVACLVGMYPDCPFGPDMRLGLAVTGQVASPIQAVWVGAWVQQSIACVTGEPCQDPVALLSAFQKLVLETTHKVMSAPMKGPDEWVAAGSADDMFHQKPVPEKAKQFAVVNDGSTSLQIRVQPTTTVAEVLQAENAIRGEQCQLAVKDGQEGLQAGQSAAGKMICIQVAVPVLECSSDEEAMRTSVSAALATEVPSDVSNAIARSARANGGEGQVAAHVRTMLECAAPCVAHVGLQAWRVAIHTPADRLQVLDAQDVHWADDELLYAMRSVQQATQSCDVWIIDPLLACQAVEQDVGAWFADWARQHVVVDPARIAVVTVLRVERHWIPVVYTIREQRLVVTIRCAQEHADGSARMHFQVAHALGCAEIEVDRRDESGDIAGHCGFYAVQFIAHAVSDAWNHQQFASPEALKSAFRNHVQCQAAVMQPWILAAGKGTGAQAKHELVIALQAELAKHGVYPDRLTERANHVVSVLGVEPVQKAMQSSNVWGELKHLGSRAKPIVRLVLPDELQQQIERRAAQGKPVGKKQPKGGSKGGSKNSSTVRASGRPILPDQVVVRDSVFQVHGGANVKQLHIHEISATAQGVVVVDAAAADPYVRAGQVISSNGLALLVVPSDDAYYGCGLKVAEVRFPADCAATGEPMLIVAQIIQLGQQEIVKCEHEVQCELGEVDSSALKLTMYRDECVCDWDLFSAKPIKAIVENLVPLQICEMPGCSCEKWHPAKRPDVQDVLLDVWRKQHCKLGFVQAGAKESDLFTVHVRVPSSIQSKLLAKSGLNGLYVEPRSPDGMKPSDQFTVVWLPKVLLPEVRQRAQAIKEDVRIAGNGSKFGVRVSVQQAEKVHQELRPGVPFLQAGLKQLYEIGPLPFGTQRENVAQVLKAIGWPARPLQPVAAATGGQGVVWQVQSTSEPPKRVIHVKGGEVLIGLVRPLVRPVVKINPGEDPLVKNDPWMQSKMAVKAPQVMYSPSQMSASAIEKMEQRIVDKVKQQVKPNQTAEGVETEDELMPAVTEGRVDRLEKQLQELATRHIQLEQKVQENNQTQQTQIQGLHSAVETQGHKMQSLFEDQMQKLEELLAKRQRLG